MVYTTSVESDISHEYDNDSFQHNYCVYHFSYDYQKIFFKSDVDGGNFFVLQDI